MATDAYSDASTLVRPRSADALLSILADRIGARFAAPTVFGAPVQHDGVTVIPVAAGWFSFGGGDGADPGNNRSGAGGGGPAP